MAGVSDRFVRQYKMSPAFVKTLLPEFSVRLSIGGVVTSVVLAYQGPLGLDQLKTDPAGSNQLVFQFFLTSLAAIWAAALVVGTKRFMLDLRYRPILFAITSLLSFAIIFALASYYFLTCEPTLLEFIQFVFPMLAVNTLTIALRPKDDYEPRFGKSVDIGRLPEIWKKLENDPLTTRISHLSGEDHYVRIVTSAGEKLCLMRLKDAISQCNPIPGLRLHRSHWVTLDAIAALSLCSKTGTAFLREGQHIPISKTGLHNLHKAYHQNNPVMKLSFSEFVALDGMRILEILRQHQLSDAKPVARSFVHQFRKSSAHHQ